MNYRWRAVGSWAVFQIMNWDGFLPRFPRFGGSCFFVRFVKAPGYRSRAPYTLPVPHVRYAPKRQLRKTPVQ